jgi:DNA-directed RNA polymerase specialized sigma24 family protein
VSPEASASIGFLAWIRAAHGTKKEDPWLYYFERLKKAYEGRVGDAGNFAAAVLMEAGVSYKPKYREDYDNPAKYIFGIARKMCGRFAARPSSPLPEDLRDPSGPELPNRGKIELDARLEYCLQLLPHKDRILFYEYFVDPGRYGREKIALRHGISVDNLRVRIHRIRRCLKSCMHE